MGMGTSNNGMPNLSQQQNAAINGQLGFGNQFPVAMPSWGNTPPMMHPGMPPQNNMMAMPSWGNAPGAGQQINQHPMMNPSQPLPQPLPPQLQQNSPLQQVQQHLQTLMAGQNPGAMPAFGNNPVITHPGMPQQNAMAMPAFGTGMVSHPVAGPVAPTK